MSTKRQTARHRRRLSVVLGGKLPAVTADVSARGFCAEMNQVFLPGSLVHGALRLKDREFPFLGEVVWAKPGDPRMSFRSRFGVRFIQVSDEFVTLLPSQRT